MSSPANPRSPAPKRDRGSSALTWLFFLLIMARPLWGIVRSLVGPQVSDTQLWMIIGGVVLAGVVAIMITRTAGGGSAQSRLPTPVAPPRQRMPDTTMTRSAVPLEWRPDPGAGYPTRAPQFEPIITGKVLFFGLILAAVIGGAIALVALG